MTVQEQLNRKLSSHEASKTERICAMESLFLFRVLAFEIGDELISEFVIGVSNAVSYEW